MEQEENAALEETSNFVIDGGDHATEQDESEIQTTESAPVEEESKPEVKEPTDNFQNRINKVTADKYAEKRRADELQAKLDELQSKPKEELIKPTLEGLDYDEEAFASANVAYQVKQEMEKQSKAKAMELQQAKEQQAQSAFKERVANFGKEDFADKAGSVPLLPDGVASELMRSEIGPELIYHLGNHLDIADSIAGMTPSRAMMELGRISANLSAKKEIKTSAAPDPIAPLKSGSSVAKERGPIGAVYV